MSEYYKKTNDDPYIYSSASIKPELNLLMIEHTFCREFLIEPRHHLTLPDFKPTINN